MSTSSSTHARLRAVAARLFAERGYDGASMSDIAAAVGVRKASLYNYYPSKKRLLTDLLDESLAAWSEACEPPLSAAGALEERLRRHLEAAVTFTIDHPDQVAIVRVASTLLSGDLGRRVQGQLGDYQRRYVTRLERLFAAAIESGDVAAADPRDLAITLLAFIDGLLNQLISNRGGTELYRQRLAEIWDRVWHGLAGRAPEAAR